MIMELSSLAERLTLLFGAVRHPSGREYRVAEVVRSVRSSGQCRLTRRDIEAVLNGRKPIPNMDCAQAIADFFRVPVGYFYDDETFRWIDREIDLLARFRDSPVRTIALDAYGLSEGSLQLVHVLVRHLRRLEGLPETSYAVRRLC